MIFFFGCLLLVFIGAKLAGCCPAVFSIRGDGLRVDTCVFSMGATLACTLWVCMPITQPGMLMKLFGYAAGLYVAPPNFGLLARASIPAQILPRHTMVRA